MKTLYESSYPKQGMTFMFENSFTHTHHSRVITISNTLETLGLFQARVWHSSHDYVCKEGLLPITHQQITMETNISHISEGNRIADIVEASPVGAAPTTSSFST